MARDDVLLQAFVDFANRLTEENDAVAVAADLAASCVDLFGVAEAGIVLAEPDGSLRYLASSSERPRLVELLEVQSAEGPCLDAYRTGRIIRCSDSPGAQNRWPRFVAQARDAGINAFTAVPMRLRGRVIGALNLLFSSESGSLDARDGAVVQAFADIASIAIMQERAVSDARAVAQQLQEALDSRVVIEQAKGVVAARSRIGIDEAFNELRAYSRRRHELLTDVARQIVERSLDPGALRRPAD